MQIMAGYFAPTPAPVVPLVQIQHVQFQAQRKTIKIDGLILKKEFLSNCLMKTRRNFFKLFNSPEWESIAKGYVQKNCSAVDDLNDKTYQKIQNHERQTRFMVRRLKC